MLTATCIDGPLKGDLVDLTNRNVRHGEVLTLVEYPRVPDEAFAFDSPPDETSIDVKYQKYRMDVYYQEGRSQSEIALVELQHIGEGL